MNTGEIRDVVIVGSGFGGSIHALRLAQAGRSVLVLERGRRYHPAEFPRDVEDVDRLFWEQPTKSDGTAGKRRGLFEVRTFSDLGVVAASGLGGGSLIYANIHVRPDPDVFSGPRWPRAISRESLEPYFDRVAATLKLARLPEDIDIPKRNAFRKAAAAVGRDIFDPDMAVAWRESPGPGREKCALRADCEFGCPVGAKQSLDLTYLADATAAGAEIRTGHFVTHIEPADDGYRVHYRTLEKATAAAGHIHSVVGRRVILSAGTLGTNEILLRSRDETRTLPGLSQALGCGFSANGDFLGSIQSCTENLQPWYGPDVTSVMRYRDIAPQFTLAAPTFNRGVMEVLASHGQPSASWLRFATPVLWRRLGTLLPRLFAMGLLSHPVKFRTPRAGPPDRMTNLFAIGQDNANGRVLLRNGRLDVRWRYFDENRALVERMTEAMREVARCYGGTFSTSFTWALFRRILTVHPLGGASLSLSAQQGVVNPDGQAHGYPGLFVADGSVVPDSIGFHPCMTICALAERTAEHVAASF
jgi:cholesterol oxidase